MEKKRISKNHYEVYENGRSIGVLYANGNIPFIIRKEVKTECHSLYDHTKAEWLMKQGRR